MANQWHSRFGNDLKKLESHYLVINTKEMTFYYKIKEPVRGIYQHLVVRKFIGMFFFP